MTDTINGVTRKEWLDSLHAKGYTPYVTFTPTRNIYTAEGSNTIRLTYASYEYLKSLEV
jgi:hypothetical protein